MKCWKGERTPRADFICGTGADDESARSDPKGDGREAEVVGGGRNHRVTDRTMRRWRQRHEEHGYDALYDYRKGQPSPKRIPVQLLEKVLRLYREKYRFQRSALPRKAERGTRRRAELHVGETGAAGGGAGGKAQPARHTSATATQTVATRDAAAHRR